MLSRSESSSGVRGLDDTTSRLFIDTPDMKGKEGGRDAGTGLLGTSLALPVTHRRGGGQVPGGGGGPRTASLLSEQGVAVYCPAPHTVHGAHVPPPEPLPQGERDHAPAIEPLFWLH